MTTAIRPDREVMEYDIVIIGAGPAGLSCAIRIKQLAQETNRDISVCILEKGSEVGAHLISGAVFETKALDELIPDWKEKNAPIKCEAKKDSFLILGKKSSFKLPTPPQMSNHGNYIISLGELGKWLASQAEDLGVEIFPGFAAAEILYDENNAVIGIATGDMGLDKNGERTEMFEAGVEIHARQTVLSEGCRGSLTKQVIKKYDLDKNSDPQTYGLGIKEIWEIDPKNHHEGEIQHTTGWPMDIKTYGGSWLYHMQDNKISIGFVVGLDYQNPYLSPYEEMQRFKTHPKIAKILEGGKRISYGARAIVEGGFQSIPKLTFPGGVLTGDSAGFLNVAKIKGNHAAMKSGIIAAESIFHCLHKEGAPFNGWECQTYMQNFENSWLYKELYKVRNIRPGFHKNLWCGLFHSAFQTLGGWRLPYTLKNHADYKQLKQAKKVKPIDYPKHDGKITFDRLTSVQLSNTNHAENQPCHLKLIDPDIPINKNLPDFDEPAQRYCPAGVYEIIEENGTKKFKINSQNCVHCKTCDIKDPEQNICWNVPQGGDGPNYSGM